MQASEAALEAAGIIMEKGLAKGTLQDSEGRVCHNGAIFIAVNGDVLNAGNPPLVHEVIRRSQIILDRREGESLAPHQLNDDEHTTAEDIILLLKENAALDDDPEAMALIEECRSRGDFVPRVILELSSVTPFPQLFTVNGSNQIVPC